MSSKTRSEQAAADPVASVTPSRPTAGMGSTTAQMKPRSMSDRDQKATRFAQDMVELAAFRFSNHGSATPASSLLAAWPPASAVNFF